MSASTPLILHATCGLKAGRRFQLHHQAIRACEELHMFKQLAKQHSTERHRWRKKGLPNRGGAL